MNHHDQCRFCGLFRGDTVYGAIDVPFDENSRYGSFASIGALIEGWSLIVPRQHCLSLRDHYGTEAFGAYVRSIVKKVEAEYGATVIFEHGPNRCGSPTSCGTDHAHLHVVPRAFPLEEMLHSSGIRQWQAVRSSQIREIADGKEYLFFSVHSGATNPVGFIQIVETPSSQFFRRAIASVLGMAEVADYKRHPLLHTSANTRERLAKAA